MTRGAQGTLLVIQILRTAKARNCSSPDAPPWTRPAFQADRPFVLATHI